jgi:hypothetical protein
MIGVNQLRLALKSPPKALKVVLVVCLMMTTEYITSEENKPAQQCVHCIVSFGILKVHKRNVSYHKL